MLFLFLFMVMVWYYGIEQRARPSRVAECSLTLVGERVRGQKETETRERERRDEMSEETQITAYLARAP
jgi:hypothetical protein